MSDADALKAEGNKLFGAKKFSEAAIKYSEAIDIDGQNAVLYANRAACHLNMKQYLSAVNDATQATTLDPKYAKAYARMATAHDALQDYSRSVVNWQSALDALPESDKKTRDQYTTGLEAAKAKIQQLQNASGPQSIVINVNEEGSLPWVIAKAMIPGLRARNDFKSSAWVIYEAYSEFMEGVNGMYETKAVGAMIMGRAGHIQSISNAVLLDNRAFHITDSQFIKQYNQQIIMEVMQRDVNDWTTSSPEKIKKAALQRLKAKGWNDVRPALSLTVRGWIMRAFMEGNMRANRQAEKEFLLQALDVLEWGRQIWHNIPSDDRGTIFELTFLRGVKNMYLHALMEGFSESKGDTLEELLQRAEDMIQEVDANPLSPHTGLPGWRMGFTDYCKGQAYSMKAFYYGKKGSNESKGSPEGRVFLKQASEAYLAAAECFPQDDETHAWFLNCAIQRMQEYGAKVRDQLDAMDKLADSYPRVVKLWHLSSLAKGGRDKIIADTFDIRKQLVAAIASGEAKLDDGMSARWDD